MESDSTETVKGAGRMESSSTETIPGADHVESGGDAGKAGQEDSCMWNGSVWEAGPEVDLRGRSSLINGLEAAGSAAGTDGSVEGADCWSGSPEPLAETDGGTEAVGGWSGSPEPPRATGSGVEAADGWSGSPKLPAETDSWNGSPETSGWGEAGPAQDAGWSCAMQKVCSGGDNKIKSMAGGVTTLWTHLAMAREALQARELVDHLKMLSFTPQQQQQTEPCKTLQQWQSMEPSVKAQQQQLRRMPTPPLWYVFSSTLWSDHTMDPVDFYLYEQQQAAFTELEEGLVEAMAHPRL